MLFGPSGAGKTSTLRAIAGMLRPRDGHIEIGGRVVYDQETNVWVATHQRRVGYLTQQYNLFPHLNVAKNVSYGLRGWAPTAAKERVRELLALLHVPRRRWPASPRPPAPGSSPRSAARTATTTTARPTSATSASAGRRSSARRGTIATW